VEISEFSPKLLIVPEERSYLYPDREIFELLEGSLRKTDVKHAKKSISREKKEFAKILKKHPPTDH